MRQPVFGVFAVIVKCVEKIIWLLQRANVRWDDICKVERMLAFIVSVMVMVLLTGTLYAAPTSFYIAGIIASIIGRAVELVSKRIGVDDNFSIWRVLGW